jgi:RNA polymerase sigma-70 factor (ECF subfamily)
MVAQILFVPRAFLRLGPGAPVPADESDERLMLRFQAGDARAFEVLVRRHRTPIFSFLVRLTADRARAEDLCQEVFLKVVKASRTWEERARFRTWVYAIARNLAVDEARRAAFRRAEPLDAPGPAGAASHPADDPQPDAAADAALIRPKLEAALAALPAEQREVFLLREYAGLRFAEIADVTGTPENTVKSRMRYALEALREGLAALGVGPGDVAPASAGGAAR